MNYKSVFDIIGPIMIGPSSSHTAGAVRIGSVAQEIFGKTPKSIKAYFYGSFAETYQGHGTNVAIIGGLLGFDTDNPNIPKSLEIAESKNINIEFIISNETPPHPNTAKLVITDGEDTLSIVGISIGGGNIQILEINDFALDFKGQAELIIHSKKLATLDNIVDIFTAKGVSYKDVTRENVSKFFLTIVENNLDKDTIQKIQTIDEVFKIIQIT